MEDIDMLGKMNAVANIAVKDLDLSRKFYEGTLGLAQVGSECDGLIAYRSGDSTIYVYRSDFAGTNQATSVTWQAGDKIDEVARALRDKGVAFEHYEMPGMTLDGDVHVGGDLRVAWFKDPDGNILNLANG